MVFNRPPSSSQPSPGGNDAQSGDIRVVGVKWQRLRAMLERDMLHGDLAGKSLPASKELAGHYGVSLPTLRKALRQLQKDGITPAAQASRSMGATSRARYRSSVVMVVPAHQRGGLDLYPPILSRLVFAMEKECTRKGLRLHLTGFYPYDRDGEMTLIRELRGRQGDFGHVFAPGIPAMHPAFRRVIGEMALQRKPLAVVDESGDFHFDLPTGAPAVLQVFRTMGNSAGREMSRVLIDKGHTKVAFLSVQHRHTWSMLRWQGVEASFQRVPQGEAIAVTDTSLQDKFDPVYALCDFTPELFREIFGCGRNEFHTELYLNQRRDARRADVLRGLEESEIKRLRQGLTMLRRYWRRRPSEEFFPRFRDFLMDEMGVVGQAARLRELFQRALALEQVTAWICANDATAIAAIDFLKHHGKEVPKNISVVAFDDAPEAQMAGLTSYLFRADILASRVCDWLAQPLPSGALTRRRPLEVPGEVVTRASVLQATSKKAEVLGAHLRRG